MSILVQLLFGWILALIAAGGYNPVTFTNQPNAPTHATVEFHGHAK